jgi:hypothetical protein
MYFAQSADVAAREMSGEMMIMAVRDSSLFNLNEIGTVLWKSADGVTPLEEIVRNKICVEFEVEPADALRDAEAFVRRLADRGIMRISEEPIHGTREKG